MQAYTHKTKPFTYCRDDKYIWGAEEILTLGDERLEYIHQFRGYETDAGWNITVQAMIPLVFPDGQLPSGKWMKNGYRWVTNRRYFKRSRFPNAKTVKDVILECIKLRCMMDSLATEYEGYKIVKAFRDPECPMSKSEIQKLDDEYEDKYGSWTHKDANAQEQMRTEMYLRGYVNGKWDAVEYEAYCNNFQEDE